MIEKKEEVKGKRSTKRKIPIHKSEEKIHEI